MKVDAKKLIFRYYELHKKIDRKKETGLSVKSYQYNLLKVKDAANYFLKHPESLTKEETLELDRISREYIKLSD